MQPYFLPYIGYFQLMSAVDEFVIYDNIQFTKKGWIHRNRILCDGQDSYISLPIRKASDYLDIRDRQLAETYADDSIKLLRRVRGAYQKAPMFNVVYPCLEEIVSFDSTDLFDYLHNSLLIIQRYCGITTPLVVSSSIPMDHSLRGEKRVLGICAQRGCDRYLNPIGGMALYDRESFADEGVKLEFLRSNVSPYTQFGQAFVPALSILDVMMFNGPDRIATMLQEYEVQ